MSTQVENMANLLKYNPHWRPGFTYGYEKKRDLYYELVKHLGERPVLGIIGLRRTGKTVLLRQLIDHLIEQGVERDRILYFSFDEERAALEDIMLELQSRIGVNIGDAGRLYIFLDEVQRLRDWQRQVKYYYDTYPELKFIVSGSSSLFLRKKAEESLAGRIFLFHLPVLGFAEFLRFKGEEDLLGRPEMFKEALQEETHLYMRRQLPELVTASESFISMYMESIVNKVVYEDLPKVFPIEYPDLLKQLLRIVASNPGITTDYAALASDLGVSRKTLARYISYLEQGFLIHKCYNFSRNLLTSEKKMKRLYLTSTTLLYNLVESPVIGRAVENLIINSTGAKFFWRRGNYEVDCVVTDQSSIIPVESKYSDSVQRKELKGLLKFLEEFSIRRGYVITRSLDSIEQIGRREIVFTPLWKWLLQH